MTAGAPVRVDKTQQCFPRLAANVQAQLLLIQHLAQAGDQGLQIDAQA
jgi:hypothetical protein